MHLTLLFCLKFGQNALKKLTQKQDNTKILYYQNF
jgi:hypothetical protein